MDVFEKEKPYHDQKKCVFREHEYTKVNEEALTKTIVLSYTVVPAGLNALKINKRS